MKKIEFLTTTQAATILGISRVAVFNRIKKGQIEAIKVGRNLLIQKDSLAEIFGKVLNKNSKNEIDIAVRKVVKEYGLALQLLGKE